MSGSTPKHSRKDKRARHQGRRESGTFLMVPTDVLNSNNFKQLSRKAKALILDIGAKYTGHNNGDLAAPWSWMKLRGWASKDTLNKALRELLRYGMLEVTRQGGLHGPSLYAFTWRPIDAKRDGLDVPSTRVASGKWRQPPEEPAHRKTKAPPRKMGTTAPVVGQEGDPAKGFGGTKGPIAGEVCPDDRAPIRDIPRELAA